jgi:hypothetical protein
MRTIATAIAFASALLTGACVSDYKLVTVKASPQRLAEITTRDFAWVNLSDGHKLELRPPRDFGDALCSSDGCVLKRDIISIEQIQASPDLVGSASAAVVALPVALAFTAVYLSVCDDNCFGSGREDPSRSQAFSSDNSDPRATLDAPYATDEQISRQWIDGLIVRHLKLMGRVNDVNPCMEAYGERPAPTYATDAEALEAIWQNRALQSGECLSQAYDEMLSTPGYVLRDRAVDLWALGAVKERWDRERCVPPNEQKQVASRPITPPERLDLGPRKGDPEVLRAIEAALANPASYTDETLPKCANGVRPRDEWPAARARVMSMGPFSRSPSIDD